MQTRKMRFSVKAIAALPAAPQGTRVSYHSDGIKGLSVEVNDSGAKTFFWFRKVRGRRTWRTIGGFPDLSMEQAVDRASEHNKLLTEWKSRGYSGANPFEQVTEPTLDAALEMYIDEHLKDTAKNPTKACKEARRQLKKYANSLRERKLSTITTDEIKKLHKSVTKNHGGYTANRVVEQLHIIFAHAKFEPNPAAIPGDELFDEQPRDRVLAPEEMKRLIPALDTRKGTPIYDFIRLLLFTGVRSGDLYSMAWQDISFDKRVWTVPDPKSGKSYEVMLIAQVLEILQSRRNDSPWVFPSPKRKGRHVTTYKKDWQELRAEAKLRDFHMHDLRHTYATYMVELGTSSFITSKALGHAEHRDGREGLRAAPPEPQARIRRREPGRPEDAGGRQERVIPSTSTRVPYTPSVNCSSLKFTRVVPALFTHAEVQS